MKIVSDAGPILSFARAGRLELLRQVVIELLIPEAVLDDITGRGRGKPGAFEVAQGTWIKSEKIRDRSLLESISEKLDLGEREALALARETGAPLLVDEREARKEALRLNIPYFGSLKILKEAKDHGIIAEAKPVLDAFIASGTYLSDALRQDFLEELGESESTPPKI
jgi:hypothetical protein